MLNMRQKHALSQVGKLIEHYINYFQPVMRFKEKQKKKLSMLYESLNPMEIKRKIIRLTEKLQKTLRYKNNDATNI